MPIESLLQRAAARTGWSLVIVLVLFSLPCPGAANTSHPQHTINISFDTQQGSMTGTSRIELPPGIPLTLFNGHLEISGAVLEGAGRTPQTVVPSAGNSITLAAAGVRRTLYVSWSLRLPEHGGGDNLISPDGITLAGHWHPVPDIDMLYRLEAQLPDTFTGITEGEIPVYRRDRDGNRYLTAGFDHPVRSIHFAAGPYTVKYREIDGVTLAAFFFPEDLALADDYLEKAAGYISRYQELIGPYPYANYSIVENRLPTGYGMPTFTLLGQAVVRLPFIKDTSLGHEVLHSWFGNSVHIQESGGNWVEGLTTYLSDHLYASDKGEGAAYRKNQLLRYASYVHGDNDMTLQQFTNASDSQPMARKVRAVGYDKGSMVFHMLRRRLGDEQFFAGLRHFYRQMKFKRASWDDIEDSFTAVGGEDLGRFFDQWLTRPDIPQLDAGGIDVSQIEGQSTVTFTIQQRTEEPFELDLPVTVKTRTGEYAETVRISDRQQEVKITVAQLPLEMYIDWEYDLMRHLRMPEIPPIWSFYLGAGDRTVVLPPEAGENPYEPLRELLERQGGKVVAPDELTTADLASGSYLFLGPAPQSLGLFAEPAHPAAGFTLDVRKNPMAPDQVIVLTTSSSTGQTAAAARKLRHYGKYSYLHFDNGMAEEKRVEPSSQGMKAELFTEPVGIQVREMPTFDEIIRTLADNRVVYVGEMHDDMASHILQLRIIQALHQMDPELAIGMEMFPRSSQEALDAYISGSIETEEEFLKESGYFDVWGFDYRLYREIIGYARRHQIPIIGLNIDKSIVSKVFKEGGLSGLDEEELLAVPSERKVDVPGYRQRLLQAFAGHNPAGSSREKFAGFIQAQSIWDETMAENIVRYLKENPGGKMVVIAGNGHVYKDSAIPPRVERRLDVPQKGVSSVRHGATGLETGYRIDYLIFTRSLELEPAPKLGVVLEVKEPESEEAEGRVRIRQISPHGKAGESGLREGDVILAIDGNPVHDINDLKIGLLDKQAGDVASLRVLRERSLLPDRELELDVELSLPMGSMGQPPTHP